MVAPFARVSVFDSKASLAGRNGGCVSVSTSGTNTVLIRGRDTGNQRSCVLGNTHRKRPQTPGARFGAAACAYVSRSPCSSTRTLISG